MTRDFTTDTVYVSLQGKLANHFKKFNQIWENYGYKQEQISKRKRTIEKHFDDLFIDMVGEEEKRLNEKRAELNVIVEETHRLVKELELSPKDDPTKTRLDNKSMTLMEEEEVLFSIVSDLRERKEVRMRRYNDINKQVEDLSAVLGEDPFVVNFDGIPTDPQVDELFRHLRTLQAEELNRKDKYNKLVAKLKEHFVHLEKFPSNHLERIIITAQPVPMPAPLSTSVMKEIGDLESSLKSQIELNRVEAETLWQKIRDLWKRLKTDESITGSFEKTHSWTEVGSQANSRKSKASTVLIAKPSLITGLQSELGRLEEEKKQNIASFIKELRDELIQIWEMCYARDGNQFTMSFYMGDRFTELDFSSDVYSEELLEKHEREVEKWRQYVEEHNKLIEGVNKRQEMWTKWISLDLKSDDPTRLANRGGALLREEKERKTLEKQIPKLEKELKKLSDKHAEKYGVKFMVWGEEISCLIEREWDEFHEEKEARKNARKKPGYDDGKSVMMTTMAGPGTSRKRPAPQTPCSSAVKTGQTPKRGKMAMTTPKSPYFPPSIVPRSGIKKTVNTERFLTPIARGPIKAVSTASGRKPRKSLRLQNKEQVPIGTAAKKDALVSPVSTYSEFSKDLLGQSTLNSSVAAAALAASREPLSNLGATTPTRNRHVQPKMTPAKSAVPFNNRF